MITERVASDVEGREQDAITSDNVNHAFSGESERIR